MENIRMVTLDTSSTQSGYAYWENGSLKDLGCINMKSQGRNADERASLMCKELLTMLQLFQPNIIVIEMACVDLNATTARLLSEIIGSVRGYAAIHDCVFVRIRPSEWRAQVKKDAHDVPTVKERAHWKAWALRRFSELYPEAFQQFPDNDDVADAVLIGQAYLNRQAQS